MKIISGQMKKDPLPRNEPKGGGRGCRSVLLHTLRGIFEAREQKECDFSTGCTGHFVPRP